MKKKALQLTEPEAETLVKLLLEQIEKLNEFESKWKHVLKPSFQEMKKDVLALYGKICDYIDY